MATLISLTGGIMMVNGVAVGDIDPVFFYDEIILSQGVQDSIARGELAMGGSLGFPQPTTGSGQPLDTQLTDLAALVYAGNALKVIRVNASENNFELIAPTSYQPLSSKLTDFSNLGYTGNALKSIRVKADETGLELAAAGGGYTDPGTDITIHGIPIGTGLNGSGNIMFGDNAFIANVSGFNCVSVGFYANASNANGTRNTAIGYFALQTNVDSSWNTAVGCQALQTAQAPGNTAVGYYALWDLAGINGAHNNEYNTAIGYKAGSNAPVDLGQILKCTFVGANANLSTDGLANVTVIGADAQGTKSNQFVLGNSLVTEIFIPGGDTCKFAWGTAPVIADSVGTVSVTDFNALLARLRAMGITA